MRARLITALGMMIKENRERVFLVLYGCQQRGLAASEAALGRDFLLTLDEDLELQQILLNAKPKSTAETMREIARFARTSEGGHRVITNWVYAPRARYLLQRRWRKDAKADLSLEPMGRTVVHGCPLESASFRRQFGLKAWLRWVFRGILLREAGAWIKAWLDPFDRKLHQAR